MVPYLAGRSWIGSWVQLIMGGGTHINKVATHRCKKFKENHKKFAGEYRQEIRGGILKNPVEEARHTSNIYRASISYIVYDEEEGRPIFSEKGVDYRYSDAEGRKRPHHTPEKAWRTQSHRLSIVERDRIGTPRKVIEEVPMLLGSGFTSDIPLKGGGGEHTWP